MELTPLHRNFRAIVFDVDGTLYTNSLMFLSNPWAYIRNVLWIYRFANMRKLLRTHLKEQSPKKLGEEFHLSFMNKSIEIFSRIVKCSHREAEILLKRHIYATWIQAVKNIPLRYGMRLLLGELKRKGYTLGILSDFAPQKKLSQWNLISYFDVIMCAEEYGTLKPSSDIFEKLRESLGCKSEEIVFVGNHLKYDGIGAANANMTSLLFFQKRIEKGISVRYPITSFLSVLGLRKTLETLNIL